MTDEKKPASPEAGQSEDAKKAQFVTQRIYIKDVSFEAPNGLMPSGSWKPKLSQDINTKVDQIEEGLFEVVLNLTIQVNVDEDKTAFLVEVHQAGLFGVSGIEGPQLQHLLSAQCPQILFPYAREAVDSLVVRGGFPPLMLPPINFDALFMQAMNDARQKAETEGEAPQSH